MTQRPPPSTPLAAALGYTTLGWRIHPCQHNDDHHPHTRGWPTTASTEQAQIRKWWDYWPSATPAIALDPPMVVVDLDVKNGIDGTANFERLLKCSALDFETPIAETPSGGLHLFFQTPITLGSSVGKIAPGIDLRAPVSSVPLPSGRNARKWLKLPRVVMAPLPAIIVERAQQEKERTLPFASTAPFQGFIWPEATHHVKAAVSAIKDAPPGAQEVTLNNKAYMLGGLVGAGELPFDLTMEVIVEAGLAMQAGDPFHPWERWQIEQKVDAALRRGMKGPWRTMASLEEQLRQSMAEHEKEQADGRSNRETGGSREA